MSHTSLTDQFKIAPQITPADLADIKAAGVTHIVCNRPDGEEAGQPGHMSLAAAVKDMGMEFDYLPMGANGVAPNAVSRTAELLREDANVFAFCRSGRRSTILYAAACVQNGEAVDGVIERLAAVGVSDTDQIAPTITALANA